MVVLVYTPTYVTHSIHVRQITAAWYNFPKERPASNPSGDQQTDVTLFTGKLIFWHERLRWQPSSVSILIHLLILIHKMYLTVSLTFNFVYVNRLLHVNFTFFFITNKLFPSGERIGSTILPPKYFELNAVVLTWFTWKLSEVFSIAFVIGVLQSTKSD